MEFAQINRAPVEEAARNMLEAFDRLGLTRLGAADLISAGGRDATAQTALASLVEAECLRENLGQYERTEAGRLAVAGPTDLTLLGRSGCHLCDEALRQIEPIATRLGARLRVVDIDTDEVLRKRYTVHVPVLFLGSRELVRHQIDSGQVRDELLRARGK